MNPARRAMLAHQGGWDELLLVVVPLVAIGSLLWVANRRVNRQLADDQERPANERASDTD